MYSTELYQSFKVNKTELNQRVGGCRAEQIEAAALVFVLLHVV